MKIQPNKPLPIYLDADDQIPNSHFPLLLYKNIFNEEGEGCAELLEVLFAANNWTNSWRWGVYPFHHYHSNTHEVLGVFKGSAEILFGGEFGEKVTVKAGDVVVIPAGVGHKCLSDENDFMVVGAYPGGCSPDMNRGELGERPDVDENIAKVLIPDSDPVFGPNDGLIIIWTNLSSSEL